MQASTIRVPDNRHPIAVEPRRDRVVVVVAGKVVAETRRALMVREADLPEVLYIPRHDVDMRALQRSATSRYCPYKGEAAYFSIMGEGACSPDCAWSYRMPHWAVCEIEDHVAFDPGRVERIEILNG